VPHRDAVVDRDRIELARYPAGLLHRVGDHLADLVEVYVSRHELGEAVGDRDDRLAEVGALYPGGPQQGAGPGHVPAVRDRT
jgi:hypothetical protein